MKFNDSFGEKGHIKFEKLGESYRTFDIDNSQKGNFLSVSFEIFFSLI